MKIAFNPSTVAALTTPPNNKDITFDLRGQNIFARGVKFCGTDTNTWRDIKINNVSIGSHTLDLRNGSNTTLTNTNGVVTINSTWRPVVDSLTSNSTTSSLSANQGRVLAGLINGKSDSDHNHDGRYVKKSGDTMWGALNFANGTWNLVGDDSYMGDCNISGHFGIKAANTTYPGIAFFNNSNAYLGILTAYSSNIKYGAYSLQFLDNGNTSVSASAQTNPFSAYNSNAVADGQAICVWGQASQLSNLSTDTGDMSLWLKRVNAKRATLNMVLDGYFWQNEGQYRVLDTSDVAGLKNNLTLHQYLSNEDTTWWPLIWGGSSHNNTSDSTGAVYKSHAVLSWQTSSQTLYATHLRTTYIDLENSRGISQVTSGGTSPYRGIRLPDLQSNGIGMFSRVGNSGNEGGIIITEDTSVIYNSFDTGWGLTVRDKDRGKADISRDATIAFGVRQDYRAYSLGGFEKSGSDNTYVLLGGGGHKLESSLNVASATNAYHLRINSVNTWSTWNWAGQSGQPSWLWGSNDGTNMYVWNPSNFNVNTAQYLRSLGNQNCQTGRIQAYGDVYTYNTYQGNTGSPTTYASVIGFGRGTRGTVEIAGGWCNTHLFWRSLRDCNDDWFSWRKVLDSSNYTEFMNNYYWANVKISTSSSTTTSPTVSNLTATNSIKMGDILLGDTNEINNTTNGGLYLNCQNSGDVSLCAGGGKVGIGTRHPSHALDVMGYTHTTGFGIDPQYLSDLESFPAFSPGDGYTYRCFEIGRSTQISCIIADRVHLIESMRGVLLNFKEGFDGQLVLLKDLRNRGVGNGNFWVMPSQCQIIKADDNSFTINENYISSAYDDGRSRFFIYSYRYSAWIEFLCS